MLGSKHLVSLCTLALLLAACDSDDGTATADATPADAAADATPADVAADATPADVAADAGPDAGPACRTFMTEGTLASAQITLDLTASFDAAGLETTTAATGTLAGGGTVSQSWTYTYASLADFVDEAAVVGRILYRTVTASGDFETGTETFAYDDEARLTGITADDTGPDDRDRVTTFSAWDAMGRPTDGVTTIQGLTCTNVPVLIVYDDAARRRTETLDLPNGEGDCGTLEARISWEAYDADGIIVEQVINATVGQEDVLTTTVSATDQVCK